MKYILLGEPNAKKSDLYFYILEKHKINNYCFEGFALVYINIKNKKYRIEIYDTIGGEKYWLFTRMFYQNTSCAILVYSVTNRYSFEYIPIWIED